MESADIESNKNSSIMESTSTESLVVVDISVPTEEVLTPTVVNSESIVVWLPMKLKSACLCPQITNCFASIQTIVGDQDFQQKTGVTITVVLELYRVMIASFLILFVPQTCGDHICSIEENAQTGTDPLYNAGFTFNCITLAAFLTMYFAEIKREGKMIAYLDVNPKCLTDNDSVGQVLERLPIEKKNTILFYDAFYQKSGYAALVCFIVNTILSGFVVYKYYLDDKTTSTFITSVLFMITKMSDVYSTVATEKNIFYSAYLKGKIQYNDVDANKKVNPGSPLTPP
jgi:hypothetical protein